MTIGPAPMIRTLWISVRLGNHISTRTASTFRHFLASLARRALRIEAIVNHRDEAAERGAHFVRARARFGMSLEAESRPVGALDALQRAVEQRLVRDLHVRAERGLVDREAVV